MFFFLVVPLTVVGAAVVVIEYSAFNIITAILFLWEVMFFTSMGKEAIAFSLQPEFHYHHKTGITTPIIITHFAGVLSVFLSCYLFLFSSATSSNQPTVLHAL